MEKNVEVFVILEGSGLRAITFQEQTNHQVQFHFWESKTTTKNQIKMWNRCHGLYRMCTHQRRTTCNQMETWFHLLVHHPIKLPAFRRLENSQTQGDMRVL